MRKIHILQNFLIITSLILLTSCSYFNGTPLEEYLGADKNLVDMAYDIAEDLEERAFPPLIARHPDQPILSTTFVNNNDLDQTSHFGRILQEHLTSRFVQLGYTAREVKLRNQMAIDPKSGEKMLSRNLIDINPQQNAQAVSVGTYSYTNRTMYISARLIDPQNSNIISSVDYKLIMDENVLAMFGLKLQPEDDMDLIEEPSQSFVSWLLY